MADTAVETGIYLRLDELGAGAWGPYYINTTTAIIVHSKDAGETLDFDRTTDGGETWTKTEVDSDSGIRALAVFFDQEVPDDAGTLVHVAWMTLTGSDYLRYVNIDVSDATVGTIRDVDTTISLSGAPEYNRVAIGKARNGNVMVAMAVQNEHKTYVSNDNFASDNNSVTNVWEGLYQEDYVLLFPANVDAGDFAALYWDRSANAISVKMFDASENTWTETAILSSMNDDPVHINMDGAVRHSDGFILGCAHSDDDTSGDDLRVFSVNPNSISSPAILTSTGDYANVYTNEAESAQCGMHINQQNNDVRVSWCGGGTWTSSTDVVYKLSTDDMASWGSEQAYSESTDDHRTCHAGRTTGDDGGKYQPCFYDDDDTTIFVNIVNDVDIAAAVTDIILTAVAGSYAITGVLAGTLYNRLITAVAGAYIVSGVAAGTLYNRLITAVAGAYSVSGVAATTLYNRFISAVAGAYSITGASATTLYNRILTAVAGAYVVTGAAAATTRAIILSAVAGVYSISGVAATTLYDRVMTAVAGVYSVSGSAASTLYNRIISAVAGSYAVSGVAASTLYNRVIDAVAGVYSISGATATTLYNRVLIAVAGVYAVTGAAATTMRGVVLTAAAGVYSISGVAATTLYNRVLNAAAGVYSIAGESATTTYSGAAAVVARIKGLWSIHGISFKHRNIVKKEVK